MYKKLRRGCCLNRLCLFLINKIVLEVENNFAKQSHNADITGGAAIHMRDVLCRGAAPRKFPIRHKVTF